MSARPGLLIAAVCTVEALGMSAFAAFPTLIPTFRAEWGISNTEAGWISGIYFAGYVCAVAVLTSLTDRVAARRIYVASMTLSALSALAFASAEGVWSASLWRLLQGIGLAGTYMPGLKALADAIPERLHGRATAFYTSSFGLGASASYLLTGWLSQALPWPAVFAILACGPALAAVVGLRALPGATPAQAPPPTSLLDFRPVLANRPALGFTLAYAAHNAELFAYRSWIVAFLVFAQARQPADAVGMTIAAATVAACVNLAGMSASIVGNELSARLGRPRTVVLVMGASAAAGLAFAVSAAGPYWLVLLLALVYGLTVGGESATLTGGVVAAAAPGYRGTTMAMHSVIGFVGAFAGPLLFGLVLDLAGGEGHHGAWIAAFAAMAAIMVLGPVPMLRFVGLRDPVR